MVTNRLTCAILGSLLVVSSARAQSITFTTFAGPQGSWGSVDGTGSAVRFSLSPIHLSGVATDRSGNLFVADQSNHTIRKVTPAGAVTTLAGLAEVSGSADGSRSTARFNTPVGVATDASGNIYVADMNNHTIRKITPAGAVITLAGSAGISGFADGTGNTARFNTPAGVAIDASGNIYVADMSNHTIRKITPAGVVTTLAGSPGVTGTADGTGSAASFMYPEGVATDNSGNLYVTDTQNHTVRKITPAGVVTTLAGSAGTAGSMDGTGAAALFNIPLGIAVDSSGNVYVADAFNGTIRKITAGVVTTFAGLAGTFGNADGTGNAARFNFPEGMAVDGIGNVYVADPNAIRKITPAGTVTTLAGLISTFGSANGTGSAAQFTFPNAVATDSSRNVYVTDPFNHIIRKITPLQVVTTLAGSAGTPGSSDGTGNAAAFNTPSGVATDSGGNVYIADTGNHTIRKIAPGGVVTTLAGSAGLSGSADGTGAAARFNNPRGVATDSSGNIYVADTANRTIRKVTPAGDVTTLAGSAGLSGSADGTGSTARFSRPRGVATDGGGNIYVADTGNFTIRKITPAGDVTTFAGTAGLQGSADGTGTAARFFDSRGVATDSNGNVYVADTGNHTIRKIAPGGVVTTLAGSAGLAGSADGTGSGARFSSPGGVAIDSAGNFYVADSRNNDIRTGNPALADAATIDASSGPIGVTRQLGTSPNNAINWQWRLVRQPADSVAELSSTSIRNPVFTPDVANDLYRFELTASNGVLTSITNVELTATTATTTTALTSSANPSVSGQFVTFTATVTGSGATPTGTVTFRDGIATLGNIALDATARASFAISTLSAGTHSISADYSGDLNYFASTSPVVTQTVNRAPTTTTISSSANPTGVGNSVTFTATVTSGATGTVTFLDGTSALGAVSLSGNTATFTTSSLAAGSHSITAAYGGDANFAGSTSSVLTQVIRGFDPNGDGNVTVADVFYLINNLFTGGPAPAAGGDANGDGSVTVADIFYLINFLFAGGPAPR